MTIEELQRNFWEEWSKTSNSEKLSWVKQNLPYLVADSITKEQGEHILHCIDGMVDSLCGLHKAGDFVEAVLEDNLTEAVERADETNEVCLRTYVLFLHNKVPYTLRELKRNKVKIGDEKC